MIYNIGGNVLNSAFNQDGISVSVAYDLSGNLVFPNLPIPTGNLNASSVVPLPDIYNNGHGWTCTGLAYDPQTNTFLVGDIGKELPASDGFASQIVRVSYDFSTVIEEIPLYTTYSSMQDVQGITIDSDGTLWICSPAENRIHHLDANGQHIGSIAITLPTGIAYSFKDDSLWVLTYANKILNINKSNGSTIASYDFAYFDALDQCFLDESHGYLYITAGSNYSTRNNVYLFNINTHQQSVACTVDSYSVEGIWIGSDRMVILNDGYYHSATVNVNQANIYELD